MAQNGRKTYGKKVLLLRSRFITRIWQAISMNIRVTINVVRTMAWPGASVAFDRGQVDSINGQWIF